MTAKVLYRKHFRYGTLSLTVQDVWAVPKQPEAGVIPQYTVRFKVRSECLTNFKQLRENPYLLLRDGTSLRRFFSNGAEKVSTYLKSTDRRLAELTFRQVMLRIEQTGRKPAKKEILKDILPYRLSQDSKKQTAASQEFMRELTRPLVKRYKFSAR